MRPRQTTAGAPSFGGPMLPLSTVLRLARRLSAAWANRAGPAADPAAWRAVDDGVARTRHARRRLTLATERGLALIRPDLSAVLASRLGDVVRQAEQLRVEHAPTRLRVPDLADWVRDVRELEAEFGAVDVRRDDAAVR